MFGEKIEEYSTKQKKTVPVWISPKYEVSKKKALEIIDKYDAIDEADFWILMNETSSGKMGYTGLIMSHNGCLKLNDCLDESMRFKPSCLTIDKDGYGDSLVYTYVNDDQGVYEVGEVSKSNCKNAYPYAMALKRCIDRVVLKNSRLAYAGVYSETEADEFRDPVRETEPKTEPKAEPKKPKKERKASPVQLNQLKQAYGSKFEEWMASKGFKSEDDITMTFADEQLKAIAEWRKKKEEEKNATV